MRIFTNTHRRRSPLPTAPRRRHIGIRSMKALHSLCTGIACVCLLACQRTEPGCFSCTLVNMGSVEAGEEQAALSIDRFVKLQTTDEALIHNIARVIPWRDRLYVLTSVPHNDVLIFDAAGAFLKKITRGRADNELIYPTDISVDEVNGTLFVLDHYRTIKRFGPDGGFIGRTSLSEPHFHFEALGGGYLFYSLNLSPKNRHTAYYSPGGKKTRGVYTSVYTGEGHIGAGGLTRRSRDSVVLFPLFSDTVYLFETRTAALSPLFVFDFRGRSANAPHKVRTFASIDDYNEHIRTGRLYSGPEGVEYLGDKLFFRFHARRDAFYVYDTHADRLVCCPRMFDDLPDFFGHAGNDGRALICSYDAEWLLRWFERHPPQTDMGRRIAAACTDEEENPILVFATIKPENGGSGNE